MSFWLHINEDLAEKYGKDYKDYIRESGSHAFNLTLGLEPMMGFAFKYVVVDMLNSIYVGSEHYVAITYLPVREDRVQTIQTARPQMDESFNVQIIYQDDNAKHGNRIMCKKDLSLNETIKIFYLVLVKYETPDTSDWYDITDLVRYIDD